MKRYNIISLVVASIATLVLILAIFMNWDQGISETYNIYLLILWMLSFAGVAVLSFFDKLSKWYIIPMLLASVISQVVLSGITRYIENVEASVSTLPTLTLVLEIGFYVALVFALFKKQKWACIYSIVYLSISLVNYISLLQNVTISGSNLFFFEYTIIATILLCVAELVFFIKPLTVKKEANAINDVEETKETKEETKETNEE